MDEIKISEKLLEIAENSGLSNEQIQELLTGEGQVPDELMDVLKKISDQTINITGEDNK
ncbi:hypothetical protein [Maridesulfovibrio zosterae]|uniref:hypothetical protein n=1 Tax=Maridesulfovibrio zosterae TaxID=82171 RepID=UPI0003FBBB52|nr:hypothetical protein [Maridesulfovibrio zosterae]